MIEREMDATENERYKWTTRPTRRVRFEGRLRMESALHVGGGKEATYTNAAVVRHFDGRPFIPGSSLKGVLRSHLERIGQVLDNIDACILHDESLLSDDLIKKLDQDGIKAKLEENALPDESFVCITPVWQKVKADATKAEEPHFKRLCHICTLFGSPILAGKIRIPDLEVDELSFSNGIEVRDGVGIDRDRGIAVDQVKYDFEVVPSETEFCFTLEVDSPDAKELGLLAAGLREMEMGYLSVGGKTTRGLGACRLEDLKIYETNFDTEGLKAYLLKDKQEAVADKDAYLNKCIEALFAGPKSTE